MLTDTKLKKSLGKHRESIEILSDAHGLNVRISLVGKITFFYRYRWEGKPVKLNVGEYPSMSIAQARERRGKFREWIVSGYDPRERIRLEMTNKEEALTVSEAFHLWIDKYCVPAGLVKVDYYKLVFDKHIDPSIGSVMIESTSRRHWVTVFESIDSRVMAHYMLSLCKRAFRFCVNREAISDNPLEGLLPGDVGSKPRMRERRLKGSELVAILGWLKHHMSPEADFLIKFIMLTGCRTAEIRKAKWVWFDFEDRAWTVPAEEFKTRTAVRRALPESAIRLLEEQKERTSSKLVVPSTRSNDSKPIAASVASNFARSIREGAGMDDWSPHDLRRTIATTLSELGCPPHVIEKILGHQMMGVMAHYNLHDYIDDQRHWLKVWDDHLAGVLGERVA